MRIVHNDLDVAGRLDTKSSWYNRVTIVRPAGIGRENGRDQIIHLTMTMAGRGNPWRVTLDRAEMAAISVLWATILREDQQEHIRETVAASIDGADRDDVPWLAPCHDKGEAP